MREIRLVLMLFICLSVRAQITPELTPAGFSPVMVTTPERPLTNLMELATAWAGSYNKQEFDVYDVGANTLSVDARRTDAFFYRDRGERYSHDIVYSLRITFNENQTFTMQFSVKEIYANNVLLQMNVADFFAPDGRLKEDYDEAKPSLERTASKIMTSFARFISP